MQNFLLSSLAFGFVYFVLVLSHAFPRGVEFRAMGLGCRYVSPLIQEK